METSQGPASPQGKETSALDNDVLVDGFLALFEECTHDALMKNKPVASFVEKFKPAINHTKAGMMKPSDFEVKAIIGRGHFGEVRVVREKASNAVFAMKVLRKSDLLNQPEISFFEEERDIMATNTSPWITQLHCAFQDTTNLYLVMDFHAGGDLLSLLSRHDDVFDEDLAKFYIAEMAVAINSLHTAGYIHRDIKPENVLLDRTGHVKLADFGSAGKLNKNQKVCSGMPVGTPDYVAPELLVAMNRAGAQGTSYGPEVDWWSLGVCAYEMLYGATPFTNEHASMVSTYANIMNHKNTLRFPDTEGNVSKEAIDLMQGLLTDAGDRLGWEGIKNHPFFHGLNLDSMRSRDAVYIPSVSGLDDTTNFDEVEKVQQQPDVEALKPQLDFSGRHLPFVGFTFTKPSADTTNSKSSRTKAESFVETATVSSLGSSPCKSLNSSALKLSSSEEGNLNNSNVLNTALCIDQTMGDGEEAIVTGLDSHVRRLIDGKDREIQRLRGLLKAEQDYWHRADSQSVGLMQNLVSMNTELQHVEDELLEVKLEEMKCEITHLETEQEKLTAQLRTKEMQLDKTQRALEQVTQQLQSQQSRLDLERRRSRDDKHKDLVLLELRNETWDQLLEEKQETIASLTARVRELEDLVEAFRDSEEQQAATVGQLHHKMNASLIDMASLSDAGSTDGKQDKTMGHATLELGNLHHDDCPAKRKVTLHVTLKAGRCSFTDNKNVAKLQELQSLVDRYSHQAREWRKREEELTAKVSGLESDKHLLQQREGMSRKLKESLVDKVSAYQREVCGLQGTIKELQNTMRGYLSSTDSTQTLSDKERELAETQAAKLSLETQMSELKEEVKQVHQRAEQQKVKVNDIQVALDEQTQLAEESRQKHQRQTEAAETRIRSLEERLASLTADKQRLERREATLTTQVETLQGLLDDRTLEVEKLTSRNTDIQSHLQQLQQRNSELQLNVERLQRKGTEASDSQAKTKAELTFQVNRLQQQNSELERRVTTDLRERQAAEDRLALAEREKERLGRRIERLEAGEEEKRGLETKLEKMGVLERENRRLETKVEKLSSLEKDKLNLEEKLEKLNMDLRREKTSVESLTAEKKSLESRLRTLDEKQRSSHNEELSKLKVKVSLLETTEREKSRLERELRRTQEEKEKLETERKKEKTQMKKLEEEKQMMRQDGEAERKKARDDADKKLRAAETKVAELEGEKATREQHMARLNREIDRLERTIGSMAAEKGNTRETAVSVAEASSETTSTQHAQEVGRLSAEINRLKHLVDRMETKQSGGRTSIEGRSNLIDRLQREKAELQRQVEGLEKQQADGKRLNSRSSRRSSLALLQEGGSLRKVRQEGEEKVKKLETELSELKAKLRAEEQKSNEQQENQKMKEELQTKLKTQQEEITNLKQRVEKEVKGAKELKERLDVQTANVAELRAELEESMKTESALVEQLEKEANNAKQAKDEVDTLKAKLKRTSTVAPAPARKSGESRFEQIQQETKIKELTAERDELKKKLLLMSSDSKKTEGSDESSQLKELQQELEQCRKEIQIRKGASDFCGGDIPAYLRKELEESNLALSEARSLLSASKRIELELRDRIDKLQRIIDNKAVENGRYLQNSQDAMAELKVFKSQYDTLQRQYKVMEDKYQSQQKEKGSNSTETVRLMEEINRKQQQYEMELKKSEKLTTVCTELEDQLKDMEQIITEFQKRETEWENIKKTYEKAVNEREEELEGATQRLQAVSAQKSDSSEKMRHQLESTKALHKAELEKLNHKLREEQSRAQKMTQRVAELEHNERSSSSVFESQMREIEALNKDSMKHKEETARMLSDNCGLRKENLQLRRHLDEAMDKFEMIIGEKVSLENFTEALQGLHFLDKYKFESTIGQQMKLIDYLQDLYVEHTGKKKKKSQSKFFTLGKKEQSMANIATAAAALDPRASTLSTISSVSQQTQQPPRLQANLTVKLTNSAMQALANSPASQAAQYAGTSGSTNSLASLASSHSSHSSCSGDDFDSQRDSAYSGSSVMSGGARAGGQTLHGTPGRSHRRRGMGPWTADQMPTPQRMHHNIPHRFATGLNTRATKCALCLGTVHFVRQASKCQECDMVVHPKCAVSVPATCGLPTEYVRHFALMMSRIYHEAADMESELDHSGVRMQGWLKVPRVNKPGWENRWCVLEGTWLTLYLQEGDASPVDSFDLSPVDADVSVHSAVTSAELSNTASSDVYYVLRLDQEPLTTCWPGRYLYLMATNFPEKQRWVASLEAIVKSTQCKDDFHRNRSQMLTVMSMKDADQREFNCCLAISSQLVLAGTEDGLYAFNPQSLNSKRNQLTQLSGFTSVHQMELAKGVDLILILTGPERRLVMLENKLVKCRMSQTLGGETTPFSAKTIDGLKCCTIFSVGLWNNASYLVVGTPTKLYVMKYNPSLGTYCVRKEFPSSEPCSCVCIAENYAIVGTERFYKINLEHPSLLDFVDRQDSSLAFAAFGAANHHSFPLAVVRVSPVDLPLEFLLCFHEFGVFVNHHGQRSRSTDVKWSGLPLAFAFVEPFLYVTYTNTIQATVVPTDRAQAKGRQTVIDIQAPRFLGQAPSPGCVYVSSCNTTTRITEIIRIRGQEAFDTDLVGEKENVGSLKTPSDKQVTWASPRKLTPRVHQLRKQGSLSSLTSNSSAGTFASVESDV